MLRPKPDPAVLGIGFISKTSLQNAKEVLLSQKTELIKPVQKLRGES
jgi:hypothetical protein